MYRLATDQEIAAGSSAISALSRWLSVKTHAQRWYGPEVTKVELSLRSESDDDGGSYYTIEGVTCYRATGTYVEQNYEGPHWDTIRAEEIAEATTGRAAALEAKRQQGIVAQKVYRERWPDRDEVYPSDQIIAYWLTNRSDELDGNLAFWAKYDAADPEDRPALIESQFEDTIDEAEHDIELNDDGDDTTFDLTVRPTVPAFYVLVAE